MAEDYLKQYRPEQVAAWYRRLADAWTTNIPELQPALAGAFLRAWVDNRNPKARIEFDSPAHLRSNSTVLNVQRFHRDVFLTNKKARVTGGAEKWAGILPRVQGAPDTAKWDMKGPLALEYESLCDVAPDIWAIAKIQRSGSAGERDIFGSLRGFQLKSKVTVAANPPRTNRLDIRFVSWQASGTDRYDWNYSERLTVANPDYESKAPVAIRPQDKTLTVYHSNAKRLEEAGQAAPYDVVLRSWSVTNAAIIAIAEIDLSRRL
ncbi:MAG: hypothetical protein H7039_24020 [Bryobacteraceae bacterium]|nr:hypothetical protein [Bryobacteraceae bacterium]